jgi:hypothetical protein
MQPAPRPALRHFSIGVGGLNSLGLGVDRYPGQSNQDRRGETTHACLL